MHSRTAIFSILLIATLFSGCKTTPSTGGSSLSDDLLPHTIRDEGGGFVVRMPVAPSIEHDSFETPKGPLRSVTYSGELSSSLYLVTLNVFPQGALDESAVAAEQLQAARDASLNSTGGEIVDELPLEMSGHPALEMTVFVDGGAYRTRIVMAGSRMYQILIASTDEDEVFTDLASAFLDSLVIQSL